jgi:hypothetical protein
MASDDGLKTEAPNTRAPQAAACQLSVSPPIAMLAYLLHGPAAAIAAAPSAFLLRSLPPAKTPFLSSLPRPVSPRRAAAAAFAFNPAAAAAPIVASLLEGPVLVWAGRLCLYYALLHVGLAGSPRNPFLSHGNTREVRRGGFVLLAAVFRVREWEDD